MKSFKSSMMKIFLFFALLSGFISYINMDPLSSSFFLIISLLFTMPVLSFSIHTWYSYFICLLFLSGIFVILVYFSSVSSMTNSKSKFSLVLLVLLTLYSGPVFIGNSSIGLSSLYLNLHWALLTFILFNLVFFMNFSSYFLSFSGALRSV